MRFVAWLVASCFRVFRPDRSHELRDIVVQFVHSGSLMGDSIIRGVMSGPGSRPLGRSTCSYDKHLWLVNICGEYSPLPEVSVYVNH